MLTCSVFGVSQYVCACVFTNTASAGQVLVGVLLCASAALVGVGAFMPSFQFTFGGGAGLALVSAWSWSLICCNSVCAQEYQTGSNHVQHSLFSLGLNYVDAVMPEDVYVAQHVVMLV
jgi:hypothetical protein